MRRLLTTGVTLGLLAACTGTQETERERACKDASALLQDPDAESRARAVAELGRWRCAEARVPLAELCAREEDSTVRFSTAKSLCWIGGRDSIPILLDLLEDPSEDVRDAAVRALCTIAGHSSPRHSDPELWRNWWERVKRED